MKLKLSKGLGFPCDVWSVEDWKDFYHALKWAANRMVSRRIPVKGKSSGKRSNAMHYRNGREAKNGDKIVMVNGGTVVAFGVLHSATPGNDYCNGEIAVMHQAEMACMCDCLHVDDLAEVLATQGLDKRPEGM